MSLKYMCKIGEDTPVLYDKKLFHPEGYEMWEPPKAKAKPKRAAKKSEADEQHVTGELDELDAMLDEAGLDVDVREVDDKA